MEEEKKAKHPTQNNESRFLKSPPPRRSKCFHTPTRYTPKNSAAATFSLSHSSSLSAAPTHCCPTGGGWVALCGGQTLRGALSRCVVRVCVQFWPAAGAPPAGVARSSAEQTPPPPSSHLPYVQRLPLPPLHEVLHPVLPEPVVLGVLGRDQEPPHPVLAALEHVSDRLRVRPVLVPLLVPDLLEVSLSRGLLLSAGGS